jgi:alpha-ketoglutaric semialdehyde dehydrogenase
MTTIQIEPLRLGVPDAPGGRTITSRNPADLEDVVAEVGAMGEAGLIEACRAAHEAQRSWSSVPAPIRSRAVERFGRLVEANRETLAQLVTREIGKPIVESRGEVQEVIDTCSFFASEGRRLYGQTIPSEVPSKRLFTFRMPLGAAYIITAGNFPVAVPSWYIAPALVCGNTLVWKPADYAPACAAAMLELIHRAGVPEDVATVAYADGETTEAGLGAALDQGLIQKVGFTGSTAVGQRIGEACGAHLQRPCLELGGKNPLVVMDDADIDLAVEGALFSGFGTAGQRCTSLGIAIVHDAVHDTFLDRLTARVEDAPVGDPRREEVLFGPLMADPFAQRFEGWLELIEDHHATSGSSATGRITAESPRAGFVGDPESGLFYHPTVVSGVRINDEIASTETFGPIIGVARVFSLEEGIDAANVSGYGLSASIYTRNPENVFRFQEEVSAGLVSVNNSTSGAEAHVPFGGNGRSGNGARQSGIWVLDEFTRWQAVNWDYSGRLQKAQMDTAELEWDPDFRLDGTGDISPAGSG